MKQFHKILSDLSKRLDVPQPKKSRILLEIAVDMEDLYNYYRRTGLDEKESLDAVKEQYTFSEESIAQLIQVHEPVLNRIMNRLSIQIKSSHQKIVLAVLLIIMTVSAVYAIVATPFIQNSSKMVWPVIGAGLITIGLSCIQIIRLYSRFVSVHKKLRSGLSTILLLEGLILFMGMWGYFYEYYKNGPLIPTSSLISVLFLSNNEILQSQLVQISQCMIKSASVMVIGLLIFIVVAAFIYIIIWRIQKIEIAETIKYLKP